MKNWNNIIDGFKNLKAMVIGDVMVDAYVWGKTNRISPEAPVPVVQITERDWRLGGAANVAKNLVTLGAQTQLIGLAGKDDSAQRIEDLAKSQDIDCALYQTSEKPTTVKTRIIAQDQHLLRIDAEDEGNLSDKENDIFIQFVLKQMEKNIPDVVIFEDYDKGTLSNQLIKAVTGFCIQHGIKTCVDPKKRNFLSYQQVDLFKPNLKECREGLNMSINPTLTADLNRAHEVLHENLNHNNTLITLSEHGVFFQNQVTAGIIPAFDRKIIDVSGAGDTVISVAALALAQNCPLKDIALISNLAGGLVCEHIGVVSIKPDWLKKELQHAV